MPDVCSCQIITANSRLKNLGKELVRLVPIGCSGAETYLLDHDNSCPAVIDKNGIEILPIVNHR